MTCNQLPLCQTPFFGAGILSLESILRQNHNELVPDEPVLAWLISTERSNLECGPGLKNGLRNSSLGKSEIGTNSSCSGQLLVGCRRCKVEAARERTSVKRQVRETCRLLKVSVL